MLQHFGTGDSAVLIDVADYKYGDVIGLGHINQLLGAFPHLGHTARRGLDSGEVHGLDGIHHHQVGGKLLNGLHHLGDVGDGGDVQVVAVHPQPHSPQLDLAGALLAGYI